MCVSKNDARIVFRKEDLPPALIAYLWPEQYVASVSAPTPIAPVTSISTPIATPTATGATPEPASSPSAVKSEPAGAGIPVYITETGELPKDEPVPALGMSVVSVPSVIAPTLTPTALEAAGAQPASASAAESREDVMQVEPTLAAAAEPAQAQTAPTTAPSSHPEEAIAMDKGAMIVEQ
ncbi:MAG: hypothetical protein EOO65_01775 [Methanosarcinales archaeon]|nr:MAG: hypothetical protein EOO65_01775 [Methanosarcinales archaeon]